MKFRDWTSINLTGIQEGYRNRLSKTAQIKHDLPTLLSRILCSSLLFVDDLFSVCFQERLCISFLQCSCLDIRLFTYALYCSLLRFSRILPILASSITFLGNFLDPLYAVYFLHSLVALSLYIQHWELLFNCILTTLISLSKCGWQIICSRSLTSTSPRKALVWYLTVCSLYAALELGTRVCALHCHLPVSPGARMG